MQILTDVQAPPSAPPPPAGSPSPTVTTTSAPSTQLPVTGASDVATGALAIGLPVLILGAVLLVVLRRRRLRTG